MELIVLIEQKEVIKDKNLEKTESCIISDGELYFRAAHRYFRMLELGGITIILPPILIIRPLREIKYAKLIILKCL